MTNEFIATIGINFLATIIVMAIAWGKFTEGVSNLKNNFSEFKKDLKDKFDKFDKSIDKVGEKIEIVGNRISHLEGKVETPLARLAQSSSPTKLTEAGEKLLTESCAKEVVDKNQRKILDLILADPKPTNAYDAQEKTIMIIRNLENDQMFLVLKDYAYKKGMDIHPILYVSAIYFRDIVLKELNLKIEDCDHKPV